MADTFSPREALQFQQYLQEVGRISDEIQDRHDQDGTERPGPDAPGALYERLGIHLIAMYRMGVPAIQVLRMVRAVAEDTADIEHQAMMAMLAGQVAESFDEVVYPVPGPEEYLQ